MDDNGETLWMGWGRRKDNFDPEEVVDLLLPSICEIISYFSPSEKTAAALEIKQFYSNQYFQPNSVLFLCGENHLDSLPKQSLVKKIIYECATV